MLRPVLYVALVAAAIRVLVPVLHRNVGYTSLDAGAGVVRIAHHVSELSGITGKRALVVGGTRGIGRGIAAQLAAAGAHVIIAGRSRVTGEETVARMRRSATSSEQKFASISVDLSSIDGCMQLVDTLIADGDIIDILVFTVGVWPDPTEPRTAAGINKVIAMDIYARFVVMHQLVLKAFLSKQAVVLSVLGSGKIPPPVSRSDIMDIVAGNRDPVLLEFLVVGPVMDAVLAQASTRPEYNGIQFLGTCPGIVNTDLLSSSGTIPQWLASILLGLADVVGATVSEDVTGLRHVSLVNAAIAGDLNRRVSFFDHEMVGRQALDLTLDKEFRAWLWDHLDRLLPDQIVA